MKRKLTSWLIYIHSILLSSYVKIITAKNANISDIAATIIIIFLSLDSHDLLYLHIINILNSTSAINHPILKQILREFEHTFIGGLLGRNHTFETGLL